MKISTDLMEVLYFSADFFLIFNSTDEVLSSRSFTLKSSITCKTSRQPQVKPRLFRCQPPAIAYYAEISRK